MFIFGVSQPFKLIFLLKNVLQFTNCVCTAKLAAAREERDKTGFLLRRI